MNRDEFFKSIWSFFTNRLLLLTAAIGVLFYILVINLFELQIVNGETYLNELSQNIAKDIAIPAQRGSIYDRYGRPLAVNQFGFTIQIDPSVSMSSKDLNMVIYNLLNLLEKNGEDFIDDLYITDYEPFEFTFYGDYALRNEENWKKEMGIDNKLTALESIEALREKFEIDPALSNIEARNIISIRSKLYLTRYSRYKLVTLATNISIDTVTNIEEDAEKYKSVLVDKEALRYYPAGKYTTHMVGYVRTISQEDGDPNELLSQGYTLTDNIGKIGIEKAFESNLRGTEGKETVIVNSVGRRVGEIEDSRIDPIMGDKVFLTVDSRFQEECYHILKETLKDTLINKMTIRSKKHDFITATDVLSSLVSSNNVSARLILASEEGSASFRLKQYALSVIDELENKEYGEDEEVIDVPALTDYNAINKILGEGIEKGKISLSDVLLTMCEQGILTADENYLYRIRTGGISPSNVIIDKIRADELTPQMINLHPSTASLVVVDVKTGDVLASPTYPTYDVNDLLNNFNPYYTSLLNDPTFPLINRPFMEQRAPGSTFKMITAISGLETGYITATTRITDEVTFTKAGIPHLNCWNRYGHGSINVVTALEVSCNYFFADVANRIGNAREKNTLESIRELNLYMSAFDLDKKSGVEIGEANAFMSSPELKAISMREGEHTDWFDGDSSATAIGQSFNDYTSAVMAKYTSVVATKGEKYDLHLLNRIVTDSGEVTQYVPVQKEMEAQISDLSWDIVHRGMIAVTEGSNGTATKIFRGFPMRVAGKTGTAEQIKGDRDHTSFAGFAPYEDPQIAVYVSIPFSDTDTTTSPATLAGKDVIEAYFKFDHQPELPISENSIVK